MYDPEMTWTHDRKVARAKGGRMVKPLFGSLSVVYALWMLLCQVQTEACWALVGNPQLLMPERINGPVWPAMIAHCQQSMQGHFVAQWLTFATVKVNSICSPSLLLYLRPRVLQLT
ncbi:hypothetical protein STEG23_033143, partial [Scotinomys teguina]